jgi:hypothetical protein
MGSPLSDATNKSECPKCGSPGKRVFTSIKIFQTSYFKEGFDPGLGKDFNSDRQRNEYLAREKPKLRKLTNRPRGTIVGKA